VRNILRGIKSLLISLLVVKAQDDLMSARDERVALMNEVNEFSFDDVESKTERLTP